MERRVADSYETGSTLWFTDSNGVEREYVPRFLSESLIDVMRAKVNDYVAFGKAHGLTDEMYVEWKATSG